MLPSKCAPRQLLTIIGVFATAVFILSFSASAQEKSKTAGAFAQPPASASEVVLPTWAEKLKLSPQQEQQVRAIVRDYDAKVAAVWQQFTECYHQTVKIEAVLLTAIEDNLSESQRKQARDLRRKTAQSEKSTAVETVPITLTAEQEAAADKVNAKYLSRLRSLNRDIAGLHNRLVSLEADRIAEVEKILTKPQLEQLSEIRQSAPLPPPPAVTGSDKK